MSGTFQSGRACRPATSTAASHLRAAPEVCGCSPELSKVETATVSRSYSWQVATTALAGVRLCVSVSPWFCVWLGPWDTHTHTRTPVDSQVQLYLKQDRKSPGKIPLIFWIRYLSAGSERQQYTGNLAALRETARLLQTDRLTLSEYTHTHTHTNTHTHTDLALQCETSLRRGIGITNTRSTGIFILVSVPTEPNISMFLLLWFICLFERDQIYNAWKSLRSENLAGPLK